METANRLATSIIGTTCLLATVLISGCNPKAPPPTDLPEVPFVAEGSLSFTRGGSELSTITIEIADTDSTRDRGLMERNSLPENSGMLFIFPEPAPQRFWMANTRISLDLVFADAEGTIVEIARYTRPQSQQGVESLVPALYVVEVAAGYTESIGLVEGDQIEFEYSQASRLPQPAD